MRKILLSLVFLFLFTTPALAHDRGLVLGEQTKNPVPPMAAGPGFLLPDSPFWGLDVLRDQIKLFLTVNARERAMLETRVAGERLAELKVLLAQVNPRGIDLALNNLVNHIDSAREILQTEKAQGKDVSSLAHDLNQAIDQEQELLDSLVKISRPQDKFLLRNAQVQITEDEIEVEDELGQAEKENETLKELTEGTRDEIEEASEAARRAQELSRALQEKAREAKREQLKIQSMSLEKTLEQQTESLETANREANKLQNNLQQSQAEKED